MNIFSVILNKTYALKMLYFQKPQKNLQKKILNLQKYIRTLKSRKLKNWVFKNQGFFYFKNFIN